MVYISNWVEYMKNVGHSGYKPAASNEKSKKWKGPKIQIDLLIVSNVLDPYFPLKHVNEG